MWYQVYIFKIFKIFGLATVSSPKYSTQSFVSKSKAFFVYSYHGIVYNVCLMCALILCGIYKINFCKLRSIDQSKMNQTIDFFGNFIIYVVSVILLFTYIISQKLALKIGNQLYSINEVLKKLELKYIEKNILCHQILVLLFDIVLWSVVIIIGCFCNVTIVEALLTHIPNIVINLLVIQYVIVLTFIYGMVKTINNEFKKKIDIEYKRALPLKTHKFKITVPYLSEIDEIIILRESCLSLINTSNDVSCFYSLPVLFCIMKLFFSIILNTYFFIKPWIIRENIVTSVNDVWAISWLILDTVTLTFLTVYVTKTIKEVKKTGDIIHRILQHSTNREVIKQLNNFSIHLLHKNIQFTALNMFSLDCTILHSIIGSMTTYLVILIQFQKE